MPFMFTTLLQSSCQAVACAAAVLGVGSHHLIFRRYEVDTVAWKLVFTYLAVCAILFIGFVGEGSCSLSTALRQVLLISSAYNVSLAASIVVYRAYFHRLHHFPGPFWARVSQFYAFTAAVKTVRGCVDVEKLHAEYGDFVRVGPRELSINRPSAIRDIYGPPTRTTRSTWYSQTSTDVTKISVNSTRDLVMHRQRKKVWERGLGPQALAVYETRISEKVDSLLSRIASHASTGTPLDMTQYAMFFGFDVMGDIGLGKEFRMLDDEAEHPAIEGVHESMMAVGVVGTVPWLLAMLGKVPGAASGYVRFTMWCGDQLREKRKVMAMEKEDSTIGVPRDVISWLLRARANGERGAPPGDAAVEEDARVLIIAGSDTISSAITNAVYYLSKNPECYKRLQEAVRREFPGGDADWTYERVRTVAYLDHVIYETLRLRPSVPRGLTRVTPPEGLMVDGVFVPGDTVTSVPTYTVQRDERYWPDAKSFDPDRWAALSTESAPWIPFSRGQWTCNGRALAIMEMRMVLGRMALRYDISFADPGMAGGGRFDFKDTFTQTLPPLPIIFTQSRGCSV